MRVFVSYKRDAVPDEPLAFQVRDALMENGHSVFIDQGMLVGSNWAPTIDDEISRSDYLVVLLTERASGSEALLGEIESAVRCRSERGKPLILPVRLAFTGPLPYTLGLYLDSLQYVLWRDDADTPRVLAELQRAIAGHQLAPSVLETMPMVTFTAPSYAVVTSRAPAYAARIPPPGGTVDLDDPFYIEPRQAETALAQVCDTSRSSTLVLKAPRQMGKSSLLVRLVAGALAAGKRAVLIDLQIFGNKVANELQLYSRFAAAIAEQLDLPVVTSNSWDSNASGPMNCTRFIEKAVLPRVSSVVLAIDEAERLIDSPFRDDFYSMLRSWHNLRGHPLKRGWKALGLVLAISSEPAMLIQGSQSPFNVVDPLQLSPLTVEQVAALNGLHGSPFSADEVQSLHRLVGGQPYLTRKALYEVSGAPSNLTVRQLFTTAATDAGPFRDHLRRFLLILEGLPDLKAAFSAIIRGMPPSDLRLAYRLEAAGLVTVAEGRALPACDLYAEYFRRVSI